MPRLTQQEALAKLAGIEASIRELVAEARELAGEYDLPYRFEDREPPSGSADPTYWSCSDEGRWDPSNC